MVKLLERTAILILATWVIGAFAAVIDLLVNLSTVSQFTGSFADTLDYFAQNVLVNFVIIAIIVVIGYVISLFIRGILLKRWDYSDTRWSYGFGFAIGALVFVTAALPINERLLPHFLEPSTLLANSLMLFFALTLAIAIGLLGRRLIPKLANKNAIITATVIGIIALTASVAGFAIDDKTAPLPKDEPIDGPNVIIITIDALRQDRVGAYDDYVSTPNIDAFAERATRFETACAHSPWTVPSMYTMLSSRYPSVHGAKMFNRGHPDIPMLAEILKSRGYDTEACVSNYTLYGELGFNRGFDRYVEYGDIAATKRLHKSAVYRVVKKLYGHALPYLDIGSVDSTTWLTKNIVKTLTRKRSKPLFLWAHYLDPHTPLLPPRKYIDLADDEAKAALDFSKMHSAAFLELEDSSLDKMVPLYEAEVRYIDERLGEIIGILEKNGYFENSIIIVTSDHGEAFFEHGHYGHGVTHYDEEISIPLFIYVPEVKPGATEYPAGLIDLTPTILNYVGITDNYDLSGIDLLPIMRGNTVDNDRLLFLDETGSDETMKSVRDARYTLIRSGVTNYTYEMVDNLEGQGPDDIIDNPPPKLYNRFEAALDDWADYIAIEKKALGDSGTGIDIGDEQKDKIKGLGYL